MEKVRISRHEFVKALDDLKGMEYQMRAIQDAGMQFDECDSGIMQAIDGYVELLEALMKDDDINPAITAFCWSCDFGMIPVMSERTNPDGTVEKREARNANELYDLILFENGLEELKDDNDVERYMNSVSWRDEEDSD